jgi:hypothetical protein
MVDGAVLGRHRVTIAEMVRGKSTANFDLPAEPAASAP